MEKQNELDGRLGENYSKEKVLKPKTQFVQGGNN
jgi:hypothetical protein